MPGSLASLTNTVRLCCACATATNCADGSSSSNANGKEQMGLNVREDTRKGVYVENLIEERVTGADAAGSILQRGYRNRYTRMQTHSALYVHTV
jgi:hypothetical protein